MGTASLLLVGCGGSDTKTAGTATTAAASGTQGTAPANATKVGVKVGVKLGETDVNNMYLTPDSTNVPAGTVSFEIVNEGSKKHEFVVLKTNTKAADLKFDSAADTAVENEADVVDENGDVEAGTTATLNVDLEAGHYVLLCNIKGHYRMRMVTDFTVS